MNICRQFLRRWMYSVWFNIYMHPPKWQKVLLTFFNLPSSTAEANSSYNMICHILLGWMWPKMMPCLFRSLLCVFSLCIPSTFFAWSFNSRRCCVGARMMKRNMLTCTRAACWGIPPRSQGLCDIPQPVGNDIRAAQGLTGKQFDLCAR